MVAIGYGRAAAAANSLVVTLVHHFINSVTNHDAGLSTQPCVDPSYSKKLSYGGQQKFDVVSWWLYE